MSGTGLAIRGRFADITGSGVENTAERLREQDDGLLLIRDGLIEWFGPWQERCGTIPASYGLHDHRGKLIVPGFIDSHVHFPQTAIIGSHGEQLLEWLENYAFPAEKRFADRKYAGRMANFFIRELLRNGTTSAMVFSTVHAGSVEAVFEAALARNMRLISGKTLMDRNAPEQLCDTPQSGYDQSRELLKKYHNNKRLLYAITPRFAPTSSPEQLAEAGRLKREFPDVYVQTHLSENRAEIAWVRELFPERATYLDVYDHYGLTGPRSIFAHCLHLEDEEWQGLARTGSTIAFCPTSNLFLGSGLFSLDRARQEQVRVGMATDVGGGTSFSLLTTLGEGYKVLQLQQQNMAGAEALYLATLGGAEALGLDHLLGSFTPGKEADCIVLDPGATPLLELRSSQAESIGELLFALMTLGDDRAVSHTYVDGRLVHKRGEVMGCKG